MSKKKNLNNTKARHSSWVLFALTAPALTHAAEAPAEADTNSLSRVVVTATRSGATNLQSTAVAVTSLSSAVLKERGVTTLLDLNGMAPNVSIGSRSGTGASAGAITIRGIGIDANPPAQPAVGIYVDDVYLPGTFGNLIGIFDVGSIDILRGPQGTLFGRNTISGAIQYVTVKPRLDDKMSGFVEVAVGNLGRKEAMAGINMPLSSIAALRISGGYTDRDGYVHDKLADVERGAEHNKQLRVQLRVDPSDDFRIDLKAEYLKQKGNGAATVPVGFNYKTALGCNFGPGPCAIPGTNPLQFSPVVPGKAVLDQFISTNPYEFAGSNSPANFDATLKLLQGVLTYDFSDTVSLKSITAYSDSVGHLQVDQDLTPLSILSVDRGVDTNKLLTQEFLLAGKFLKKRLNATLGIYYYHNNSSNVGSVSSVFGGPPGNPFGDYSIKTESVATYGQGTYKLSDQWSLVGGLRWTTETISPSNTVLSALNIQNPAAKYKNTSPLLGASFQATEDIFLFSKWSRGFRAGNFSPNSGGYYGFGPETAETYEAGARLEFLDHRLRINPTVFFTDWNNIQFNQVVNVPGGAFPLPIIANAGDAKLKGLEIEMQAKLSPAFTAMASGALLSGHYTRLDASLNNGLAPGVQRLTLASDLKRAPKSQFSLGGRYQAALGEGYKLAFSVNYAWQAEQRSATTDLDFVPIKAYGLLSARLELKDVDDKWLLALSGTNLTDQTYLIGGVNYGNTGTIPTVTNDIGRPREYRVSLRHNF